MPENNNLKIFDIVIYNCDYEDIIKLIYLSIINSNQILISYVTAHSLNLSVKNHDLIKLFNEFDYVHADGVGVFIASRILHGNNGLGKKITGSDFYPLLIDEGIKYNWTFFLFGDTDETLEKAICKNNKLIIRGVQSGYYYNEIKLIEKVNASCSDILIVGLGCPKQEKWIIENKDKLSVKVIIAVGDGIKVFAGIKKRGNRFFQTLGLEWVIRLINNPFLFWKRYLIGIPLFLFRVIRSKYSNDK
ncbi:MAG: WecB/TagA/CpsF family glycosyltransferase [Ignavibacteriaceae bacterium]